MWKPDAMNAALLNELCMALTFHGLNHLLLLVSSTLQELSLLLHEALDKINHQEMLHFVANKQAGSKLQRIASSVYIRLFIFNHVKTVQTFALALSLAMFSSH